MAKQSKYDIESGSEAEVEPNFQTDEVYEIGGSAEKVNNVQTDETYSLTSIAPAQEEITAPEPEKVSINKVDLTEYKTGHAGNVTGGQVDLAIDRFHVIQEDDTAYAKLDLLARLRILENEADSFVGDIIRKIKAII